MNTNRLRLAALALASIAMGSAKAQTEPEATVQADIVSHYMWRGTDKGGISIQPTASIGWQGMKLGITGSTGLDKDDSEEINLWLGYEWNGLNIGVTDYWRSGVDYGKLDRYFFFEEAESAHQLEANIGYSCRWFSLQAYTMVWGNDFKYDSHRDAEFRINGKHAYSTYVELRVPFYMAGLDWDLKAGMTPFESACYVDGSEQKQYFYADKLTCVLASLRATKNFEFGDMKVPIFAELHTNPYTQRANFFVGLSIIPFK